MYHTYIISIENKHVMPLKNTTNQLTSNVDRS